MTAIQPGPTPETESVAVIEDDQATSGIWSPVVGRETDDLLNDLNLPDAKSRETLRNEAIAVLRRCVPPMVPNGVETGLVVGYVQSGKTMSFTAVTALARDNGYQVIIVIAGVSTPLFNQSRERLEKDLRLRVRLDHKWKHFSNPKTEAQYSIQSTLDEWRDPSVPQGEKQSILITVMKNHRHLRNLERLLSYLRMDQVPVLVIDDEADQAGLNSAVRDGPGRESTTYRRLVAIRKLLPQHTFLQYTASTLRLRRPHC